MQFFEFGSVIGFFLGILLFQLYSKLCACCIPLVTSAMFFSLLIFIAGAIVYQNRDLRVLVSFLEVCQELLQQHPLIIQLTKFIQQN